MQAFVDFQKKWSSFNLLRDRERENNLYNKFNLKPKQYNFIHEDQNRNYIVDSKYCNHNGAVVMKRGLTNNIFDYLTLIENANEIHVIESCMAFILDLVKDFQNNNVFVHRYARILPDFEIPIYNKPWNIIR
jgi:hypothetical protein